MCHEPRIRCASVALCLLLVGCSFDKSGLPLNSNDNVNNTGNNNNVSQDCGDGVVQGGEACDDGNPDSGDGCAADCSMEVGWTCTGEPSACAPICGDGILIAGFEACDDGDLSPNDGCGPDCTVEHGYQCTGSPSVCTAVCGDGLVATGVEGCDDGNTAVDDGCGADCQAEPGYVCFGEPSTCNQTCGNGSLDTGELCDDGNIIGCDGCAADCSRADNECGDGFTECGEICDDANQNNCDGCTSTCTRVDNQCGDNIAECGEVCDDGNAIDCDGCRGDCSAQETGCGDGFLCGAEVCDDGNTDNCDGCISDCTRADDLCGDGIRECGEPCEGSDFGGATCASETGGSSPGGNLACTGGCAIDTTGCTAVSLCTGHTSCPAGQQCTSGSCVSVGNTCDDSPVQLTISEIRNDTLAHLTDNYNGGDNGLACPEANTGDTHGLDRVYQIDMVAGDYFTAWVHPQGWSPVLYITDSCPINSCDRARNHAWWTQDHGSERIDHIATGAETIYLVVDGDGGAGDYTLEFIRGSQSDWTALNDSHEVFFSEVHANPATSVSGINDACEWFEIYNADATMSRNLEGVSFDSPEGAFVIDHPLVIGPQEYMVMAQFAELNSNCGVGPVTWSYEGSSFNLYYMSACLIEIWDANDDLVDHIDFNGSGWPFMDGRSMYLCTNRLDTSSNDSSGNWRTTPNSNSYDYQGTVAGTTYTNYGTPAVVNPGPCN